MTNPILITGATGRHGNTGEYLVRRLREAGHPVRILARRRSERTEELAALGAQIAVGDLHDRRTLVPALVDVDLAYFTYPIDDGVVTAAANYAAAVREVGRSPRTVVMSMGPARPDSPSNLGRAQWLAEQVLDWAGLDLLILRVAALFHENLLVLHSHSVREYAVFRNSFGTGKIAWIGAGDAAELALAALLHPERFTDTVYFAKGSEEYSHLEIAQLLNESTAGTVHFEPISRDQWRDDLLALSRIPGADAVNAAMAQHISAVGQMVAESGRALPADPDTLRELTGREPVTMREFLLANREAFMPVS
ncbi:NmrA-like protein [Mycolicibacterium canariasense]|uniref:NmrA-like protein n=1 Tax=Mycolicibacterium canariasense TaxID=228230 RepID=A0A100WFD4_MYCCR|nr:NmrA family NAD(P)-binding protein [Mycolicibacterium canariasense]MCV7211668.1 NmrA family NAD(P)-binding protein [Mycolicibacterium canariasense]ORV00455.1 NmrA family transcriptional regulator [Mycolicibacterium canariasense]GAS96924.1 NmrA-like protein [Mycolicibacterium canariasense]